MRYREVGCRDESEEKDQANEDKDEWYVDPQSSNKQHKADKAPVEISVVYLFGLVDSIGLTHIATLWKPCELLYAAPVAPPWPSNGTVVSWMGS